MRYYHGYESVLESAQATPGYLQNTLVLPEKVSKLVKKKVPLRTIWSEDRKDMVCSFGKM